MAKDDLSGTDKNCTVVGLMSPKEGRLTVMIEDFRKSEENNFYNNVRKVSLGPTQ